jgi:hypothetical protein
MEYKKYKKLCDEVYANIFSIFYPKDAHIDKTIMEEEFKETNDTEHIAIKNESFLTWVAIMNKANLREIADILKKNNKNYDITDMPTLEERIKSLNENDKNKCFELINAVKILDSDKYGIKKYRNYI